MEAIASEALGEACIQLLHKARACGVGGWREMITTRRLAQRQGASRTFIDEGRVHLHRRSSRTDLGVRVIRR